MTIALCKICSAAGQATAAEHWVEDETGRRPICGACLDALEIPSQQVILLPTVGEMEDFLAQEALPLVPKYMEIYLGIPKSRRLTAEEANLWLRRADQTY